MRELLFYSAVTGWTLGFIVHLLSIADIDLTDKVPYVWFLPAGVFVVVIPMILCLKDNKELKQYQQSGMHSRLNQFSFFKIIFKHTPTWLKVIAVGSFITPS